MDVAQSLAEALNLQVSSHRTDQPQLGVHENLYGDAFINPFGIDGNISRNDLFTREFKCGQCGAMSKCLSDRK